MHADGAVFPDAYSDEEVAGERATMRRALAAVFRPDGPGAYCVGCQNAGMRNCGQFTECSGATCISCHRPLNPPAAMPADEAAQVEAPPEAVSDAAVEAACQAFSRMQGRQAYAKIAHNLTYEQFAKAMRAALAAAHPAMVAENKNLRDNLVVNTEWARTERRGRLAAEAENARLRAVPDGEAVAWRARSHSRADWDFGSTTSKACGAAIRNNEEVIADLEPLYPAAQLRAAVLAERKRIEPLIESAVFSQFERSSDGTHYTLLTGPATIVMAVNAAIDRARANKDQGHE